MNIEKRTLPALPSFILFIRNIKFSLRSLKYLCSYQPFPDERNQRMWRDYCEPVLRHEHTHRFPLAEGQGPRQRTLKVA
jgi:hypothetical protein